MHQCLLECWIKLINDVFSLLHREVFEEEIVLGWFLWLGPCFLLLLSLESVYILSGRCSLCLKYWFLLCGHWTNFLLLSLIFKFIILWWNLFLGWGQDRLHLRKTIRYGSIFSWFSHSGGVIDSLTCCEPLILDLLTKRIENGVWECSAECCLLCWCLLVGSAHDGRLFGKRW